MLLARRNSNWLPDVFNDFFDTDYLPRTSATAPAINVIEKDNEYDVEVAAPGMTKDDFKVSLDEDENLVIDLEKKKQEDSGNKGQYLRREFSYTQFHQSLSVENGVLTVRLPKYTPQDLKKETKVIHID